MKADKSKQRGAVRRGKQPEEIGFADYNEALGGSSPLPSTIDQAYDDVLTQVYPLKANLSVLQTFCDKYLNFESAPDRARKRKQAADDGPRVSFEPAAPWVLMQVCNYPKIEIKTDNIGWLSQHELAFGLPVKCYKHKGAKRVFTHLAMVFPFIFVDCPLSMSGGREVYGWAKAGITLERIPPYFDPTAPRCLVSISRKRYSPPTENDRTSTAGLLQPNAEDPGQDETLLQIFQQRPFLSGRAGFSNLAASVPKVAQAYMTAVSGLLDATGRFLSGSDPSGIPFIDKDTRSLGSVLQSLYGYMNDFVPSYFRTLLGQECSPDDVEPAAIRIVTLKQFRDAKDTTQACYQALVVSKMVVDKVIDAGLLFDPLSGDPSGGVQLKLLITDEEEIVSELGIETSGITSIGNQPAHSILPVVPFWARMNLSYGKVEAEHWRTRYSMWAESPSPGQKETPVPNPPANVEYVLYGSGASQEIQGPVSYDKAVVRFLPIPAQTKVLQKLIDHYLNDFDNGHTFGLPSNDGMSLVHVVVVTFDDMKAKIGGVEVEEYGDRILALVVPADWTSKRNGRVRKVFLPLYSFVGTDWDYLTDHEVYGRLTFRSTLESSQDPWMKFPVDANIIPHEVLSVRTTVFPNETSNEAKEVPLIKIFTAPEDARGDPLAQRFMKGARDCQSDAYIEYLGLTEYLTRSAAAEKPFYSVSLKQIRDARYADKAAFQSLVGVPRKIEYKKASMLQPVKIMVDNSFINFRIFELMGLVDRSTRWVTLGPTIPLSLSGRMVDRIADNICWRVGTGVWQDNPKHETYVAKQRKA
jgi:hypothetical protein